VLKNLVCGTWSDVSVQIAKSDFLSATRWPIRTPKFGLWHDCTRFHLSLPRISTLAPSWKAKVRLLAHGAQPDVKGAGIKMIQENELIHLLLGLGILAFIFANRLRLKRIPASGILLAAYCVLLAGWILTVLEGFFLGGVLNLLEHACYAISSVLIFIWCWKVFARKQNEVKG
jgi:hypothetical protein